MKKTPKKVSDLPKHNSVYIQTKYEAVLKRFFAKEPAECMSDKSDKQNYLPASSNIHTSGTQVNACFGGICTKTLLCFDL